MINLILDDVTDAQDMITEALSLTSDDGIATVEALTEAIYNLQAARRKLVSHLECEL